LHTKGWRWSLIASCKSDDAPDLSRLEAFNLFQLSKEFKKPGRASIDLKPGVKSDYGA
jgi:hypothetical protein